MPAEMIARDRTSLLIGPRRLIVGKGTGEESDRPFQFRQVFVDGSLQDRVRSVEVAMGEMIAHAGDLAPGNGWLRGEQVVWQCLDRLAYLQQPDPNGIEDKAVGKGAALQVGTDRVDGGLDIRQPLALSVAHSVTRSCSILARTPGLRSCAGIKSTRAPSMASMSAWTRPNPNRLMPGGMSASMSTSLSARSSPRATLPNTRRFLIPRAAATPTRSCRLRHTRRPTGPASRAISGACRRRPITRSKPAASTSAARTGMEGWRFSPS